MIIDRPHFSAEINEIIGNPPHWVNRVGGTILLFIITSFVISSALIVIPKEHILPVVLYGQLTADAAKHTPEYLVKGMLDAGQLDGLKKAGVVQIEIPLDNSSQDKISLKGRLLKIIPPIKNGKISYTVKLDQKSAEFLAGKLPEIESIGGTLIFESEKRTLLKSLME
ncbi:hypothetical protein TH53_09760 [Pedobacter lusitanus]|uniref:Uncharacterized protein n=1 Tax=Pedobacter lusitanus TaxID=1503925 RepID=A0A0D0F724_9SPHI|nr:hypothetical protein [Pedobacter lusitanus]KIO77383.1 hypothetical protein TH53_09760 [Pedobacter lusitanus]